MIRTIGRLAVMACVLSAACAGGMDDALAPTTTPSGSTPAPTGAAVAGAGSAKPATMQGMQGTGTANATTGQPTDSANNPMAAAPPQMPGAPALSDECGLNTKFVGDEYCIKAPPPDKGFQLRHGPSNYDNPEPKYVLEPGQEVTEPYMGVSGNDSEIYFYYRQQRMRPGSHHLLISTSGPGLIVSSQNPISDLPAGGKIAPEDEGVGIALAARAPLGGSIHFINTTEKPILKEFWVNFWYKDASTVKERATALFSGAPINVQPGTHVVISADCPIQGSGRLLRLFGHKHANNVRWSTYRIRGAQRDLLFEDYENWEEPLILEYSSITQNPTPDRAARKPGGMSGIIDLKAGDTLRYECEIINNTNKVFTGENEAVDDEMCIQNGTLVGASIMRGTCETATTPVN